MATLKLTEKTIAALPLPTERAQEYYWDTKLTGFGVVVGTTARTFVVRKWVGRKKCKVVIGRQGAVRDDGHRWSVELARKRAQELLGEMASGTNPNAAKRGRAGGPTLREGLALHVDAMTKKRRSARSIDTMTKEVGKYLGEWLDRPIAELTGEELGELHNSIKARARVRVGTNPDNPKGAPLANRIVSHVSAIWNSLNRKHQGALGSWNPAKAVVRDVLKPKRERIADDEFAGWHARVQTLSPVRRDLSLFCLFSALRSEEARYVRWEHVDWSRRVLSIPDPKGGEARAFELPLSKTCMEILRRRQKESALTCAALAVPDDAGWVFVSRTRAAPFVAQPVQEAKEWRAADNGKRQRFLPGPHTARRTWESVAQETGISELDQHVLTNHSFGSHNVNATYIAQSMDHLRDCADRVDRALWNRIDGRRTTRSLRRQRAPRER